MSESSEPHDQTGIGPEWFKLAATSLVHSVLEKYRYVAAFTAFTFGFPK
jgi:hypothetical protein